MLAVPAPSVEEWLGEDVRPHAVDMVEIKMDRHTEGITSSTLNTREAQGREVLLDIGGGRRHDPDRPKAERRCPVENQLQLQLERSEV